MSCLLRPAILIAAALLLSSRAVTAQLAAAFDAANLYLGNWLGEFVGEVALYGAFLCLAAGLASAVRAGTLGGGARWIARLGALAGGAGLIASVRNVTPVVAPVADAANLLLPGFLIAWGAWLVVAPRRRGQR